MSELGTQYVLGYIHEEKTDSINRVNRRSARGVCQRHISLIASQFPLASFRSHKERKSQARLGIAPEPQPERKMTVLIFSDHKGSYRFILRPPANLDLQHWLERCRSWNRTEAGWVSLERLEIDG